MNTIPTDGNESNQQAPQPLLHIHPETGQPVISGVSEACVHFTAYNAVVAAIRRCHASYDGERRPRSMQLYGTTGVGKSYLLRAYARSYPRMVRGDGVTVPVLYVPIPGAPTNKSLATQLLRSLGAPSAESGSASEQFARFETLARRAGVQLVLLDEMHHFIDRGTAKSHAKVADSLKMVVENLNVACVAAGAPRTKALFTMNAQLRSRFALSMRMHPFSIRTQQELSQLRGFLQALGRRADPRLLPLLTDPYFAVATFYATDGILRQIVDLVAEIDARVICGAEPTLETASSAFLETLWPAAPFDRNPFNPTCFAVHRLNRSDELYEPSLYDGDNHPADPDCLPDAA
jgi:Bacterial TniB protein